MSDDIPVYRYDPNPVDFAAEEAFVVALGEVKKGHRLLIRHPDRDLTVVVDDVVENEDGTVGLAVSEWKP